MYRLLSSCFRPSDPETSLRRLTALLVWVFASFFVRAEGRIDGSYKPQERRIGRSIAPVSYHSGTGGFSLPLVTYRAMKTVLLVSNRKPGDDAGRAEKVSARQRLFAERGWQVELSYVPEPYLPMFPVAVATAVRRCRSVRPDVVITMNNPFHMHLIGYTLKHLYGCPWVAEFRDPLSNHPDWTEESILRRIAGRIERLTVKSADRVAWLDGIQLEDNYFRTTYPAVPTDRFVKLPPMGYDPVQFEDSTPANHTGFTITYAGSFYDGWIEPYGFIDGFAMFANDLSNADRSELVAQFFGDWSPNYDDAVRDAGVDDLIVTHGFVSHGNLVPELVGSDALLYIGGTNPANRLSIPSKMWDYLAARTPIIALVDPDFAAADWVRDNDVGVVANPDDAEAVRDAVDAIYSDRFQYDPDPAIFERYSRERHADAYVALLDQVADRQGRSP